MSNIISIDDPNLIAYLKTLRIEHVGNSLKNNKMRFNYDRTDELERAIHEYYGDNATCNPLEFGACLKQVLSLIDVLKDMGV